MSRNLTAQGTGPWGKVFRRARKHGGVWLGGGTLALMMILALLAPLIAPHDPYAQDLTRRLIDPVWYSGGSWSFPLGTDGLGRCYLSRLLHGAQVSLLIGFAAMLISGLIGTTLGILGGYYGGRVDMVVNFLILTRLSLPVVLVALAVVAVAGGSLTVVIAVLGLLIWDRFAVVVRSATLQVRKLEYVTAAQALGCSVPHILIREILPNIINQVIVVATLEMAHAILLEAALSFLGLGVQPPTPSWGLMVAEGKAFMFFKGWLIAIPGMALFSLVLAINILGDAVRDVAAPESRS